MLSESARKVRRVFEVGVVNLPVCKNIYWKVAPTYFRWRINPKVDKYPLTIDPFELHYVDPTIIDRFSGIQGEGKARIHDIGDINSGDWDQSIKALDETLITASRLSETALFRSMRSHFLEGYCWEETELFEQFEAHDQSKTVWHNISTKAELSDRCRDLDNLYEAIDSEGYRTQRQLLNENGRNCHIDKAGFLNMLINEVMVDVGRDGTLLLVDGRHRLTIAKLLGIEKIPVLIVARHSKWMENLIKKQNEVSDHPDMKYLRNLNND